MNLKLFTKFASPLFLLFSFPNPVLADYVLEDESLGALEISLENRHFYVEVGAYTQWDSVRGETKYIGSSFSPLNFWHCSNKIEEQYLNKLYKEVKYLNEYDDVKKQQLNKLYNDVKEQVKASGCHKFNSRLVLNNKASNLHGWSCETCSNYERKEIAEKYVRLRTKGDLNNTRVYIGSSTEEVIDLATISYLPLNTFSGDGVRSSETKREGNVLVKANPSKKLYFYTFKKHGKVNQHSTVLMDQPYAPEYVIGKYSFDEPSISDSKPASQQSPPVNRSSSRGEESDNNNNARTSSSSSGGGLSDINKAIDDFNGTLNRIRRIFR